MLTLVRLKEVLSYFPETGDFLRLSALRNCSKFLLGKTAGSINRLGYRQIKIDGYLYLAHRLAWFYEFGKWPTNQIDHINGNKSDNRISNLREATGSQNLMNRGKPANNTSGFKGVSWINRYSCWQATIRIEDKNKFLGRFGSREEAANAYNRAALKHHGEFAMLDL